MLLQRGYNNDDDSEDDDDEDDEGDDDDGGVTTFNYWSTKWKQARPEPIWRRPIWSQNLPRRQLGSCGGARLNAPGG
jgi:hypothetical protein